MAASAPPNITQLSSVCRPKCYKAPGQPVLAPVLGRMVVPASLPPGLAYVPHYVQRKLQTTGQVTSTRKLVSAVSANPAPLLDWASADAVDVLPVWASTAAELVPACNGAYPAFSHKVAVADLGAGRGRGLVATVDISPEETILAVPFTKVFTSNPESDLHWSCEMAFRLLTEKHKCHEKPESSQWCTWLGSLPPIIVTPLAWTDAELALLCDEDLYAQVKEMQTCICDTYEGLQLELEAMGFGWNAFQWAVQIFHSRCFFEPRLMQHLTVPGIDMANHSHMPNATVQVKHSPNACQGMDAIAEVCEPSPAGSSQFLLCSGSTTIRAGEEVTISYGSWPNEAFLLLFGFVPTHNPSDSVVLFHSLLEVLEFSLQVLGSKGIHISESVQQAAASSITKYVESTLDPPLIVTAEGVSPRIYMALSRVQKILSEEFSEASNQASNSTSEVEQLILHKQHVAELRVSDVVELAAKTKLQQIGKQLASNPVNHGHGNSHLTDNHSSTASLLGQAGDQQHMTSPDATVTYSRARDLKQIELLVDEKLSDVPVDMQAQVSRINAVRPYVLDTALRYVASKQLILRKTLSALHGLLFSE